MVELHPWAPLKSMIGNILAFLLSLGTLSFLFTKPESWMPHLTDDEYGFPFLSAREHLMFKDLVLMGTSIITMNELAALHLQNKKNHAMPKAEKVHCSSHIICREGNKGKSSGNFVKDEIPKTMQLCI